MRLHSAARKYVDVPVHFYDRNRREVLAASLQFVALAPGTRPTAATTWATAPLVERRATLYVVGPDAGGPAAGVTVPVLLIPPGGVDLWIRPTDAMESDPVFAERIIVV